MTKVKEEIHIMYLNEKYWKKVKKGEKRWKNGIFAAFMLDMGPQLNSNSFKMHATISFDIVIHNIHEKNV